VGPAHDDQAAAALDRVGQLVEQPLGDQTGRLDLSGGQRRLGPHPSGGRGEPRVADLLEHPQGPPGIDVRPAGVGLHRVVGTQRPHDRLVPAVVDLAGQVHPTLEGGIGLDGLAPDGEQRALGGVGQRPLIGGGRLGREGSFGGVDLALGPLEAAGEDLEVRGIDEGQPGGPTIRSVEGRRGALEGQGEGVLDVAGLAERAVGEVGEGEALDQLGAGVELGCPSPRP